MSIEAMKQALEALERSVATCFDQYAHQQAMSQPDHFINQAITSLRQAIAEAEKQEPVAWMYRISPAGWELTFNVDDTLGAHKVFPLTHPQPKPEWVGLTDDEIVECWARPTMWATAHAIEAKLKEENT